MSEQNKNEIGKISWVDLTVENAEEVRDFYREVVGWKPTALSMGEYDDFVMTPATDDKPISGICHARGENKGLPSQWLIYIIVENLETSIARCLELGGEVISKTRNAGNSGRFCVIKDIAGASVALFQYN